MPPGTRSVNMNQLGQALTTLTDPPIRALYVYNSNPAAVTSDQRAVRAGLARDDLFTVVHELFPTDTVDFADVVLPATTQFEQLDLHTAAGYYLNLNLPATQPKGEARSNHDTFVALAAAMGFQEPCFKDRPEDMVRQAVEDSPYWSHVTFDKLQADGFARAKTPNVPHVPFAGGQYPTPSGKIELYSEQMARDGYSPVPTYEPLVESIRRDPELAARYPIQLISPASHVLTSSSHAHQAAAQGDRPWLELSAEDAGERGLSDGDIARVWNDRGACELLVKIVPDLQPGVAVTEKVRWPKLSPDRRNVNFTTAQRLADMGGGATYHENLVQVARAEPGPPATPNRLD
jgi:anaerobic selenocysteine-containing dehydrogenase